MKKTYERAVKHFYILIMWFFRWIFLMNYENDGTLWARIEALCSYLYGSFSFRNIAFILWERVMETRVTSLSEVVSELFTEHTVSIIVL